ncbi:MAG TPA: acylphosphatase [Bacteroidales bacterium]|nr:acylphosphatase [Bacteroidales bacterium]
MEGKNIILYRIRIRGRVQGVGFRWNAARLARTLGLKGYVRNMPDGSVYIEAEGDRIFLDEYLSWCRSGPVHSAVESVEHEQDIPTGYSDFNIEH